MDYNTNVYTSGPLAAVYQAQDQSAKAGGADLQNLIKGMSLPKEQVEMQTYQHLLDDPNYVKANAQFQMAATQAKLGDEEKKVAVNGLDRLLIQLQANPDPASQQQLILKSFQEKGVDPTSPMAQAILADPFGKTKEARDKLVSTMGYTPQVAGKMQEQTAQDEAAMARLDKQLASHEKTARISAGSHAATASQSELNAAFRDNTSNINNVRSQLTKFATAEAQTDAVRQLVGSGMTQKAAESVVSAEKKRLTDELNTLQAQRQHLQKQSKVYSGFNFNQTPAPTGGAGGGSYTYDPEKGLVPQ